jgi:hypothetical protein
MDTSILLREPLKNWQKNVSNQHPKKMKIKRKVKERKKRRTYLHQPLHQAKMLNPLQMKKSQKRRKKKKLIQSKK